MVVEEKQSLKLEVKFVLSSAEISALSLQSAPVTNQCLFRPAAV